MYNAVIQPKITEMLMEDIITHLRKSTRHQLSRILEKNSRLRKGLAKFFTPVFTFSHISNTHLNVFKWFLCERPAEN